MSRQDNSAQGRREGHVASGSVDVDFMDVALYAPYSRIGAVYREVADRSIWRAMLNFCEEAL